MQPEFQTVLALLGVIVLLGLLGRAFRRHMERITAMFLSMAVYCVVTGLLFGWRYMLSLMTVSAFIGCLIGTKFDEQIEEDRAA